MKIDVAGVEAGQFEAFRQVVAALRGEHGCPWDKAQTFESLKPCMVNEMTEALAGIDIYNSTGDAENLCEELGDVLLQVVLFARIAQEEGLFTMEDVIRGISRKMIRRHPHVFAEEQSTPEAQEVPGRWEEIKRAEKKNRTPLQEQQEKEAFERAARWITQKLGETEK
ncbi:MAG: MazG nucleotide pyrophosphohydrolase domain-containing protein [Lachnospiraceae bacterium]|nr:MazG nucleotide pyrophosphohydrolase domain-containing protein [Lachnospiraceae bacterium]